jgi:uncharacterized protein (DUF983 family)
MIKKGTKAYSVVHRKCPHCHEGEFYEDKNPYNLSAMSPVLKRCPVCDRSLHMEPGFYFGAMYVAYSIGVAVMMTVWVATMVLGLDLNYWTIVIIIASILIVASPFIYAISKIIWANLFFSYKGVEKTAEELQN